MAVGLGVELAGLDRPADQILDQGLGDAGIDPVMAHLVADAVGRPAQRQLGEVAGADDEAAALVGEAEQIVGPQPRLNVLEGDVVDRLPLGEGVAHVLEHLHRRRADVDLLADDAERLHQRPGIALGGVAGGEAGHGEAEDGRCAAASRKSQVLAATIRAWVESSPPETPMTRWLPLVAWKRRARPWTWMLNAS